MGVIIKNGVIYGAGQSSSVFKVSSTLLASNWSGNEAPYTQALTVNGLLASDTPVLDIVMSGNYDDDKELGKAWTNVYRAVPSTNNLTFYSDEELEIDIPINILVYRFIEPFSLENATSSVVGLDTSDATATAGDIIEGKIAYANGVKLIGTNPGGPITSDAVLVVSVPTGSDVTANKGNLSLTPTMWASGDDNTLDCALFIIPSSMFDAQNAWTVTAADETHTVSKTVTISTNKQYYVKINFFSGVIFKDGDQCTEWTGGWHANSNYWLSRSDWPRVSGDYPSTSTALSPSASSGWSCVETTKNKIKLDDWNTLKFTLSNAPTDYYAICAVVGDGDGSLIDSRWCVASLEVPRSIGNEFSIDLSLVTGEYYIAFATYNGRWFSVNNVYLSE